MTERQYLLLGTCANAALGLVGVAFSIAASSQAIMLDGLFNVTYFFTGLFTLKVADLLARGDDPQFPFGYASFEPLVNGLKGVLVLGVTLMAVVGAVQALFAGGSSMDAGIATVYAVIATLICLGVAVTMARGSTRTASPLVAADAQNWRLNFALSAAVLVAFGFALFLQGTAWAYLVPFVDPVMVLATVALCISIPIRQSWQALLELLNRAAPSEVVGAIRATVESCIASLPSQELHLRIVQTGRTRVVLAHVIVPRGHEVGPIDHLDELRRRTQAALDHAHQNTVIEMVFTADPMLGQFTSTPSNDPTRTQPA